ncbi:MAG: hypothetical protein ABGX16_26120, partial [Pirellulales bacterium]
SRPTARCFRHFVAIAVSKPQPESRALADCRRTLRLQAVVFSSISALLHPLIIFRLILQVRQSLLTMTSIDPQADQGR